MDPHAATEHDLSAVEAAAWDSLVAGLAPGTAFHAFTLATVTAAGGPAARTVILRDVDPSARTLGFNTDARSGKFGEIGREPRVTLLFHDPAARLQLRIEGEARLHHEDAVAAARCAVIPEKGRWVYRQACAPGIELASRDGAARLGLLSETAASAHFVFVSVCVHQIDWLYLADTGNRRARIGYRPPAARWLAP
ncbi:pyridoxamine 5'-phosphate oxidase family protein [Acuticoccus sp. M5D2P5]|uniref:pyridoxamine 5'-phosphate oxidase family protein n=1 Tax=Acuticoccus kalidii TaxID=2910977 RepID=UPI001F2318C9|nr:pyridoxamine 5'-phosphate oxidase family protein [Acuticoccus kalidii]MCF3936293.1 pyridoxamine 5'-phosphate oxidase family protein [Acuticoccus kalidii]